MSPKPFRFGVIVSAGGSARDLREKALAIEDAGFSVLLMADHLLEMLPPLVTLAYIAAVTSRIRLGTFVINNDFRHPALLARDAAALDLVSEGRFELGLGAGHMKVEYDQIGIAFDEPRARTDRLIESMRIVSELLEGKTVDHTGSHYRVLGHKSYPPPVQRPRPPLLVGGYGRRLLTAAAATADIIGLAGITHDAEGRVVTTGMSEESTRLRLDWIRQAAPERAAGLELNALVQVVTPAGKNDDLSQVESSLGLPAATIRRSPYVLLGSPDAMAEQLLERREQLGLSYLSVFERDWRTLAPVLSRLSNR